MPTRRMPQGFGGLDRVTVRMTAGRRFCQTTCHFLLECKQAKAIWECKISYLVASRQEVHAVIFGLRIRWSLIGDAIHDRTGHRSARG